MDSLFSIGKRVAVVTGGMGQMGCEFVSALVERGARVCVIDTASTPKTRKKQMTAAFRSGRARYYGADVTNLSDLRRVCDDVCRRWTSPSILVNNAGLDSPPDAPASEVGPFEYYPEKSYDKVMEVNVKGAVLCCQVFGGAMARVRSGSIINVSSIYGMLSPCQDIYEFRRKKGCVFFKPVAYSVSKSAILNLTRYLATYWAKKGVRVNTLTMAGIANSQPREFLEAYCSRMPMGRMADADEMVGAMLFLASGASSYVTGSNLVVDGGWSAW